MARYSLCMQHCVHGGCGPWPCKHCSTFGGCAIATSAFPLRAIGWGGGGGGGYQVLLVLVQSNLHSEREDDIDSPGKSSLPAPPPISTPMSCMCVNLPDFPLSVVESPGTRLV